MANEQVLGAEAIEKIKELTQQAERHHLRFEQPPGEQPDVYVMYDVKDGEWTRIIAPGRMRALELQSLSSVARVANNIAAMNKEDVEITVGRGSITIAYQDEDKRVWEHVMALPTTGAFGLLERFDGVPKAYQQRAFWNLLRGPFRGCVDKDKAGVFARLRWSGEEGYEREVGVAKESISRSARQEVGGIEAVPEELLFHVAVYDVPGLRDRRYPVHCIVDIDKTDKTFAMQPTYLEISRAYEAAVGDAVDFLRGELDDSINVLWGNRRNV